MSEQLTTSIEWLAKINFKVVEDDEDLVLLFDWDEKDPELQEWTELGQEKQQQFVLEALKRAL